MFTKKNVMILAGCVATANAAEVDVALPVSHFHQEQIDAKIEELLEEYPMMRWEQALTEALEHLSAEHMAKPQLGEAPLAEQEQMLETLGNSKPLKGERFSEAQTEVVSDSSYESDETLSYRGEAASDPVETDSVDGWTMVTKKQRTSIRAASPQTPTKKPVVSFDEFKAAGQEEGPDVIIQFGKPSSPTPSSSELSSSELSSSDPSTPKKTRKERDLENRRRNNIRREVEAEAQRGELEAELQKRESEGAYIGEWTEVQGKTSRSSAPRSDVRRSSAAPEPATMTIEEYIEALGHVKFGAPSATPVTVSTPVDVEKRVRSQKKTLPESTTSISEEGFEGEEDFGAFYETSNFATPQQKQTKKQRDAANREKFSEMKRNGGYTPKVKESSEQEQTPFFNGRMIVGREETVDSLKEKLEEVATKELELEAAARNLVQQDAASSRREQDGRVEALLEKDRADIAMIHKYSQERKMKRAKNQAKSGSYENKTAERRSAKQAEKQRLTEDLVKMAQKQKGDEELMRIQAEAAREAAGRAEAKSPANKEKQAAKEERKLKKKEAQAAKKAEEEKGRLTLTDKVNPQGETSKPWISTAAGIATVAGASTAFLFAFMGAMWYLLKGSKPAGAGEYAALATRESAFHEEDDDDFDSDIEDEFGSQVDFMENRGELVIEIDAN